MRSPRAQSELLVYQDQLVTSFWRRNGAAMVPQSAPPGLHPLVRARMIVALCWTTVQQARTPTCKKTDIQVLIIAIILLLLLLVADYCGFQLIQKAENLLFLTSLIV